MTHGQDNSPFQGPSAQGEEPVPGPGGGLTSEDATASMPQVSSGPQTSAVPVQGAASQSSGYPGASGGASHGQPSGYPQGYPYGQPASGSASPYGQPSSIPTPQQPYTSSPAYGEPSPAGGYAASTSAVSTEPRQKKAFGLPVLVGTALIASLLGGSIGGAVGASGSKEGADGQSASGNEVVSTGQKGTAVSAVATKASPSVVTIAAIKQGDGGSGSGIVLDKEGHILTNAHVVTVGGSTDSVDLQVRLWDNKVYKAKLVGADPLADLAVIKVDAPNLQPATLGDSSSISVGDKAVVIGAPLGLSGTVTDGIISTKSRTIGLTNSTAQDEENPKASDKIYVNVIQTDAALNHGNSGGALVDGDGKVIGVNVAMYSSSSSGESSGSSGLGFAIPINAAKRVAESLMKDGKASHGFLGVQVRSQRPEGIEGDTIFSSGAVVESTVSGSPADKAGLKKGDVITSVGDMAVEDSKSLTAAVRTYPAGHEAVFKVNRNGKDYEIKVTLGDIPAKQE